jgi:hypothetical protein
LSHYVTVPWLVFALWTKLFSKRLNLRKVLVLSGKGTPYKIRCTAK